MRTLHLLALTVLVLAPSASAQVQQGLIELSGAASFISNDGFTVFSFAPSFGYFFTDALEAGAAINYTKAEDRDGFGTFTVNGTYHFGNPGATTVPFLSAQVGTSISGNSDLVFGGSGGAKFFFLPGGALKGEVLMLTTGSDTQIGAQAGVSIFF